MCLSTVYKNVMEPASIVMKNGWVQACFVGCDLMERQVEIVGNLESANLVDGYVIVRETE